MNNPIHHQIRVGLTSIFLFVFSYNTFAQSYYGFLTDNYSGVNSVINNPATIVDTPYNFDINLIGVSSTVSNDVYSINSISDLTDDNFEFPDSLIENFSNNNFLYSYTDILGPSFLVNINSKSAFSVYTRVRSITNASDINGAELEQFVDDFDAETDDFTITNLNLYTSTHAWGEVGASYARIIKDDNQHFIKGGVTVKYLVGIGSAYGKAENLSANYIANGEDFLDNLADGTISLDGSINYGISYSDLEEDFETDNLELPRSLGFDIGAVYEWRPDYQDYYVQDKNGNQVLDRTRNKYKLRVGLSITDIGSLKYKEGLINNLAINSNTLEFIGELGGANDFNEVQTILNDDAYTDLINDAVAGSEFEDFVTQLQNANDINEVENILDNNSEQLVDLLEDAEDIENIDDILNDFNIASINSEDGEVKMTLPTALHLNADWSFNKNLFVNLATDLSLTSRSKSGKNAIANELRLTPRYESRAFSFFSPIRIVQGIGTEWGAGLRAGPLYLGSGSILSNLISSNIQGVDVYVGLKIPGLKSRNKDQDLDGVKDRKDACIDIPGDPENNGCPWKDTDEDGVLDKDDDCTEVVGPVENNGCPWPDTDDDGVADRDDLCADTKGPKENMGCPWPDNDGDSVIDIEDYCLETPGPKENNGCPWPDTDGDSVLDKDDACKEIPGPIENNGCPEVTETIQKELNNYAKTILFDSGRASIKDESLNTIVDIVNILNEYANAKFMVEGHTDSLGSATTNQSLSEKRANSVRDFLIENGIHPDRLTAVGYGEDIPIANNRTSSGRKQNRRVEINLIK